MLNCIEVVKLVKFTQAFFSDNVLTNF